MNFQVGRLLDPTDQDPWFQGMEAAAQEAERMAMDRRAAICIWDADNMPIVLLLNDQKWQPNSGIVRIA